MPLTVPLTPSIAFFFPPYQYYYLFIFTHLILAGSHVTVMAHPGHESVRLKCHIGSRTIGVHRVFMAEIVCVNPEPRSSLNLLVLASL